MHRYLVRIWKAVGFMRTELYGDKEPFTKGVSLYVNGSFFVPYYRQQRKVKNKIKNVCLL